LFFRYTDSVNKGHLASYDGINLNVLANPDTIHSGVGSSKIIYNNKLYSWYTTECWTVGSHQYCSYKLAEYNGNSINLINLPGSPNNLIEKFILNNNLYIALGYQYPHMGTQYSFSMLYKFDGTNFSEVNGAGYDCYFGCGFSGAPLIFNDSLYFIYNSGNYSKYILAKYNGTTVSYIDNPTNSYGLQGSLIKYNNSLFFDYNLGYPKSCLAKYDGNQVSLIQNSNNNDNGIAGNMIIFNNKLYFQYKNESGNFQLAKYSDTVTNPPVVFNVTSGGTYLSCESGSKVKLSGSQANTMYYLFKNNVLNDSLEGTTFAIEWHNKTVGTYTVKAKNVLGTTIMNGNAAIAVANFVPSPATTISGIKNVCTAMSNVVYRVDSIAHATSYIWRLPNGKLDTTLSNSISVNFDTNTVATYISVRGHNCLANGDSAVINVILNQMPGIAGTISGLDSVCYNYFSTIYSVAPIPDATTYEWNFPDYFYGNSDSNSIKLLFYNTTAQGYVSVKGVNCMGKGDSTFKIINIKIVPDSAKAISGLTSVYPGQNNILYSVPPIPNATSYSWILPQGYNGQSDSNSILISFDGSALSDKINVRGSNGCDFGVGANLAIYVATGKWQYVDVIDYYSTPIFAVEDSVIVCITEDEFVYSSDYGSTWIHNGYYIPFNTKDIVLYNNKIFIAGNYGVQVSSDKGMNWTSLNDGLDTNIITAFYIKDSILYAGSYSGNLFSITINDTIWNSNYGTLPNSNTYNSMIFTQNRWYVSTNYGVFYSDDNTVSWTSASNGLSNLIVNDLIVKDGILFAATNGGISFSNDSANSWSTATYYNPINAVNKLCVVGNRMFAATYSGVYISNDNGLNWYTINDGFFCNIFYDIISCGEFIYTSCSEGIFKRAFNDMAFIEGTSISIQGPVSFCRNQTNIQYSINPIPNASSYIWTLPDVLTGYSSSNTINVTIQNWGSTGDVKVKAIGDSVYYKLHFDIVDKPVLNFNLQSGFYNNTHGLPSNYIYSMVKDYQGNIWIATSSGISKFDGYSFSTIFNFISNSKSGITVDQQNNLWVVTSTKVHKYDGNSLFSFDSSNSALAGSSFYSITSDNLNNIWVTTDIGFSKFDGNVWTNYTLPNNSMYSYIIKADKQNNIWIDANNGIYRFDGVNFYYFNESNIGLNSSNIRSIAVDSSNTIWFATSSGLAKYNGNTWSYINANDYSFLGNVQYLYVDDFDNKWMKSGYYILKYDNLNWTNYWVGSGDISNILIDDYGKCLIGTYGNGLAYFTTSNINGQINVCKGQNNISYSIPFVSGATSYVWQLPAGAFGSSTSNTILVYFTSLAQSGDVTIMATNNCGNSNIQSLPIMVKNCTGIEENNSIANLKVFPNPFTNSTAFTYILKEYQHVDLMIFDITGRLVKQLVNENQTQGEHSFTFNAGNLQAGVYYYRLRLGNEVATGKFILAK
jgi:ligand-binding sensor domain-containing protein